MRSQEVSDNKDAGYSETEFSKNISVLDLPEYTRVSVSCLVTFFDKVILVD